MEGEGEGGRGGERREKERGIYSHEVIIPSFTYNAFAIASASSATLSEEHSIFPCRSYSHTICDHFIKKLSMN